MKQIQTCASMRFGEKWNRETQSYAGGIRNGVWRKYLDTGELFLEETYTQDKDEVINSEL